MDQQQILTDTEDLPAEVRTYAKSILDLSNEAAALTEDDDDSTAAEALLQRLQDLSAGFAAGLAMARPNLIEAPDIVPYAGAHGEQGAGSGSWVVSCQRECQKNLHECIEYVVDLAHAGKFKAALDTNLQCTIMNLNCTAKCTKRKA